MLLCMKVTCYQAETSVRIWYKTVTPLTELGVLTAFLNHICTHTHTHTHITQWYAPCQDRPHTELTLKIYKISHFVVIWFS